jgi:Ca2+-binding EF-hand superfamily protein
MYTEVMRILDTEGERQRQEFIEELIKGFQLDEETGD